MEECQVIYKILNWQLNKNIYKNRQLTTRQIERQIEGYKQTELYIIEEFYIDRYMER